MKKPYQVEAQRAVKRFEETASQGNPAVQLVLPMAGAMGWLRQGVGELIRQAGLQLVGLLMEEEVREAGRAWLPRRPYRRVLVVAQTASENSFWKPGASRGSKLCG